MSRGGIEENTSGMKRGSGLSNDEGSSGDTDSTRSPTPTWVRAIIAVLGVVLLMIVFAVLTTDSEDQGASNNARGAVIDARDGSVVAADGTTLVPGWSSQTGGGASIAVPAPSLDAARYDRSSYEVLDSRDLAFIVKDPTQHLDRKVVLHGYVQQFDTVTGLDTFHALVDAVPHSSRFGYRDRAVISSPTSEILADVVEGDLVTMYATVGGPITYDARGDVRITVPTFTAQIVEVTGYSN